MKNVMDKLIKIFALLLLTQTISCQNMNDVPVWKPSVCQPNRASGKGDLSVVIGPNEIKTLEGLVAGLPSLDSSGQWGDSGKVFSDMRGTPIAADVIYFSHYEDKYYHLKIDFDVEFMKKAINEIHCSDEFEIFELNKKESDGSSKYGGFSGLVFGFAPQGMVVVWRSYGSHQIEIGRYQAEVIKDDKELEKNMFPPREMPRKEVVAMYVLPEPATCAKWDMYRKRYNLKIEAVSENKAFRLFESRIENYNGEFLFEFRPEISKQEYTQKALPRSISIYWETGLKKNFQGNIFFNEKAIFEKFKDLKEVDKQNLQIKIAQDNGSIEIVLNSEPLKMDSIRIWGHSGDGSDPVYKESYK